jgi:hypothetical protein
MSTAVTVVATSFICGPRIAALAFSPAIERTGIVSFVLAICAKSFARKPRSGCCGSSTKRMASRNRNAARSRSGMVLQSFASESLADLSQRASLRIRQPQPWQVRPENSILRSQVLVLKEEFLVDQRSFPACALRIRDHAATGP